MSDFIEDIYDGKAILYSCGFHQIEDIEIKPIFSEGYTKFLGRTKREGTTFYLILNHPYANMSSHDEIMNTIVHELLHMLPNCLNHGVVWKSYASVVFRKTGIDIQRLASREMTMAYTKARGTVKNTHTYQVECTQCHRRLGKKYKRKVDVIASIINDPYQQRYVCPYCKTKKLIVKTDC